MVVMRGSKKIRFDINNPGKGKNSKAHFQIEERVRGLKKDEWEDAGEHRYYFLDLNKNHWEYWP